MSVNNYKKDEEQEQVIKRDTIIRLFSYMKGYKKEVIEVLFLISVTLAVSMVNPQLMQIGIDRYIPQKNIIGLMGIVAIACVINVISMFCMRARIKKMTYVSNKVLLEIRQALYEHIQKLSFGFFDNRPVGKILARVIGDVNSLKELLNNSVITLIPDLFTVIIVLVIMLIKSPPLAISAVILLPLLILGVGSIEIIAHKRWQSFRKKNSNLNAYTHENFSGIRVIQCFNGEEKVVRTFKELILEHRKSFINAIRLNDYFWPMVELSWGMGTASVLFIGVTMMQKGAMSIGLLIAFITYLAMFWQPIMNLSNLYNQLTTNLVGAERIFEILDTKPDIINVNDAIQMPSIKGKVVFDGVSFGYEQEKIILNNMSFEVKEGEVIALVGPTGAGKSTIVNIISRFYDIWGGKVLIDGQDISEVDIESLRKQMGIMTQDTFLFSGTIKDNIRYGKLDATDEEIVAAAKAVHAHEFIVELNGGYDAKVNERGTRLSVGQRQLIAFARTILSRPNILVLDEATSSIDTHTERLVQQGIEEIIKGRTSFIIAHRLSTIQKADRIFVIDDGKIIEEGNHEHLLQCKGLYHQLYMAQFKMIG